MPQLPAPLHVELAPVFRVGTALALGHSPGRMRAADLDAPFRGMRRRRTPPVTVDLTEPLARDRIQREHVLDQARAYFAVAPDHTFLAGRSAAVVWGLPCVHGERLEAAVLSPHRAPRRPGIRGRKLAPHLTSVRVSGGIRLTSPAATFAMLGGELSHRDLVALGDAIVRIPRDHRGRPIPDQQLASLEQLVGATNAPGRKNRARLAAALADVRVGSMSVLETDYRLLAAAAGLPEPVLDVEIRHPSGALIGIVDAAYPEFHTIAEVEGDHHRTSRMQWERDIEKHAALTALGWEVIRVTAAHIRGAHPRAAESVASALRRHGWTG